MLVLEFSFLFDFPLQNSRGLYLQGSVLWIFILYTHHSVTYPWLGLPSAGPHPGAGAPHDTHIGMTILGGHQGGWGWRGHTAPGGGRHEQSRWWPWLWGWNLASAAEGGGHGTELEKWGTGSQAPPPGAVGRHQGPAREGLVQVESGWVGSLANSTECEGRGPEMGHQADKRRTLKGAQGTCCQR